MNDLSQLRAVEIAKYERAYKRTSKGKYSMGEWRKQNFALYLSTRSKKWNNFIDIGCGWGETLEIAKQHGIENVMGVEVVDYLCDHKHILHIEGAHDLSLFGDQSFDLVSSQDVMEHIIEQDVDAVLSEMWRITRKALFFTISSHPHSVSDGDNLHITVHPKEWWAAKIRAATGKDKITDLSAEMPGAVNHLCGYFEVSR